jgi:DHA2 family multidrug resistance protein
VAQQLNSSAGGRRLLVIGALLAVYLQAVTISLPNAAVFHLGGTLSMTDDEIGWVFTSYIAASAIVMPMTRWIAGRYGRKAVFQVSVAFFALGLLLATQATTVLGFVAARIVQGAASGPLAPLSLTILLDELPAERHSDINLALTVTLLLGLLSGPPIGGWLAEYLGWQSLFYAGLLLAGFIFLAIGFSLGEKKTEGNERLDFFGLATFSLGMVGLQMVLDRGERLEWFASTEIWIEALGSILGFYLYIVHILTTDAHFLNKALFKDRDFVLSTAIFFGFGFVLLPTVALTSPMLEELLKYPAETTGYMTIPRSVALLSALLLTWRAASWIDNRILVILGMALTIWANWWMLGYSPLMDWRPVVAAGMLQGAGLGILMPALTRAGFRTLSPALRPEGSVLFNLARLYGSTIGIAIVQIFFYNNTQAMHLALAKNLTPHQVGLHAPGLVSGAGPHLLNEIVTVQAAAIALFGQFKLLMIAMIIVSPLALFLRNPRPLRAISGADK